MTHGHADRQICGGTPCLGRNHAVGGTICHTLLTGAGLLAGLAINSLAAAGLAGDDARVAALFGPGQQIAAGSYQSAWLGTLDASAWPWINHPQLGWLYVLDSGEGTAAWLHTDALGWLHVDGERGPWLYRSESASWQYAYDGASAGIRFHDLAARLNWTAAAPPAAYTVAARGALWRAETTLATAALEIGNRTAYPARTNPSTRRWNTVPASDWTSGFWPGCLWLMYDFTGKPEWRQLAEEWMVGLASQQYNTTTHDVGFMMFCSYGEAYRLTGDPAYRDILLTSAGSLDTRYSLLTKAFRSWSWGRWASGRNFTVIVDNMMNLELMWWAARQPGGKAVWADHALQHALTTKRELVRANSSTYHVVVFDSLTGGVLERTTHQGANADSDWARGQAWAIYGYVMAYDETGDPRMLAAARETTEFYLASLPDDGVPPWDFALADTASAPRDSSAAAIAASALIELSRLVDGAEADRYWSAGLHMLASLMSNRFQNGATSAILDHGTAHFPAGSFDTGLIWGDYYFLEALLRYLDRVGR
jgi:hypothetical protein